eukprot:261560-Pyramimonas_sp.AAC.1
MALKSVRRERPNLPPPKPPGKCRRNAVLKDGSLSREETCAAALQSTGRVDRTVSAYYELANKSTT